MKLSSKDYWREIQGDVDFSLPEENPLQLWLNNQINKYEKGVVFEIGCFPGRFLYPFAKAGFDVSGIDYLEKTSYLFDEFCKAGCTTGKFYIGDLFDTPISDKFDIVTSFGFIEHFNNFEEVIEKQASLVNANGSVIIEVPNFVGFFQLIPRFLFDYKNFRRHNLKAMKPSKWAKILEGLGYRIDSIEYIGGYLLWFRTKNRSWVYLRTRLIVTKMCEFMVNSIFKRCFKSYACVIILTATKVK